MQARGTASALESTFIVDTSEDAGDVSGMIQAAMNRYQTLNAAAGSAVEGASVVFPPGALTISVDVIVGAGSDAASADILAQIGLDSTVASGVGSSLYVSTTATTDPVLPMTLSLPLPTLSGLVGYAKSLFLGEDTSKYAISFVAERKATNETFVGFIPNNEITFADGKAQFATSNWGSYRLIELAPEAEKPVERVVVNTVAEVAPRRQNEVRELPKMSITGREPFVATPEQKLTVRGENLGGLRAFIRDRRLAVAPSSDGLSAQITLPASDELQATTGRAGGLFIIALASEGSPGFETNVLVTNIPSTGTSGPVVFTGSPASVCARQPLVTWDNRVAAGTGLAPCVGKQIQETTCTSSIRENCLLGANQRAARR